METSKEVLNHLILAVCHLCDRTRQLASSGSKDPFELVPVREALGMVSSTLDTLSSMWEQEVPGALPVELAGNDLSGLEWPSSGDEQDPSAGRGFE